MYDNDKIYRWRGFTKGGYYYIGRKLKTGRELNRENRIQAGIVVGWALFIIIALQYI